MTEHNAPGTDDGTTPRFRAALAAVPAYKAGRPPAPAEGLPAYKLSSNENPYPPLPSVHKVVADAVGEINRYPDPANAELAETLAERFGVPASHIVVGNGSVTVAQQLVNATAGEGDEVVFAWRSFEAYPMLVLLAGATPVMVPLLADESHDLDAMAAAITERTRLVFVCNPNNPTGTVIHRAELERFLDRVPRHVVVVLDEAYREFIRDERVPDGVELYRERPNVVVLRTFSKAYGLAGLRVGFAIAHEAAADELRKTGMPFAVNRLAQVAAIASVGAEAELLERVEALVQERTRVLETLIGQGWTVFDSQANFVWLRLGERTGEFAAMCEAAGVSVRPFEGEGCRITIGETEANTIFLEQAARFMEK
ncbi:histidinol-phosphate transaminase [Embleya sp. NPDC020630]|uniref:histidinol-phosphate transaminase n=1 Tax=unclassified Embleya TaxID=2699296 RepID=UPI0037A06D71